VNQDDWLNFWFKPQLFMHDSWVSMLDQTLLNRHSSALAWHLSFDYVCDCYQLPPEYSEFEDSFVKEILDELIKNKKELLNIACLMISGVAVDNSTSIAIRRKILQRNRALSLKKRFLANKQNLDDNELGIYFIFISIIRTQPELWSRFRLFFPKESVKKVEQAGKDVLSLKANDNAIRRAWKEIFRLKQELTPDFSLTTADDAIGLIEAEATNDTLEVSTDELTDETLDSPHKEHIEQQQAMAS